MVRQILLDNKDENYRLFTAKLVPNLQPSNFIGVRVPVVRKIAKNIAKNGLEFLQQNFSKTSYLLDNTSFVEERLLYGFVINYSKISIDKKLLFYDKLLPYLSSWYETDSIFQGVNDFKISSNKQVVFNYFSTISLSPDEYISRSGVVVLFRYFLDSEYIDNVIQIFTKIQPNFYYVRTALAWAIAEILAVDFNKGKQLILSGKICKEVVLLAIKKAKESYKITDSQKLILTKINKTIKNN